MVSQDVQSIHPVLKKSISFIKDWNAWMELWEETQLAEFLHSLLFFGFKVEASRAEVVARLCFYLEVADEHTNGHSFEKEGDWKYAGVTTFGKDVGSLPRLRQVIASKAFQVLCQDFFRSQHDERDGNAPSWAWVVTEPLALEKIFWFFRLEGRAIENLPYAFEADNHGKLASRFLIELSQFAWECENYNKWFRHEVTREMIEALRQARPQILAILCGIGQIDLVLERNYDLDERCLQKLEELALANEVSLPDGYRRPETLAVACLAGSQAARVLMVLRSNKEESARFEEIRKLKQARREAEEGLKKLTS